MSERSHMVPAPEGEYFETCRFAVFRSCAGGRHCRALLWLMGGDYLAAQFSFSWLFGFVYFLYPLRGCFFWTMFITPPTRNGRW